MSKPLRILLPCAKSFYSKRGESITGAQHFTNGFFKHFDNSGDCVIGVAFGAVPNYKKLTISKRERAGKLWIDISMNVPTAEILQFSWDQKDPEINAMLDQIAAAFTEAKADVFCTNGLSAMFYLLFLAAKRAQLPIVTIHHGIWYLEAKAHGKFSWTELRQRRWLEKQLITGSQRNVFLSPLSYRIFSKEISRIPAQQKRLITLPYNPVFINNADAETPPDRPLTIGLIGRWDPVKNHDAYLKLAKEATRQNLPWKFVAATTIERNSRSLAGIIPEYTKYIEIFPHMSPQELNVFYNKIDIIVVPSFVETFCGVVMEGILKNKPVIIAPKVGWVDEYRAYGLKRWIMNFNNPRKVLRRIQELSTQQPPAELVQSVLTNNSPEVVYAQYRDLFREVITEYAHRSTRI